MGRKTIRPLAQVPAHNCLFNDSGQKWLIRGTEAITKRISPPGAQSAWQSFGAFPGRHTKNIRALFFLPTFSYY